MKYDIYFHYDLDGHASAAMIRAFLRSRGDDIARYVPVTYGDRNEKGWNNEGLLKKGRPAIVVDFQYHPGAVWWFDHHVSGIKNKTWRKKFRPDKQHRLDPGYKSCTHLIYDSLRRDFGWKPPRHFTELVKWLDVIDGARYPSAKSTVALKEPAILVNAYIEGLPHTVKERARLVELLAERSLRGVVKAPGVAAALRSLRAKAGASLRFIRKNTRMLGKVTFLDLTGDPLHGFFRYAPYYFHPRVAYGMRMRKRGKYWYLGAGANPWHRGPKAHDIGAIMGHYGGGGHKGVGAAEFLTKRQALAALEEISARLNA